nr:hypothetical protein [Acidithiobacillus sp. 'AMD consortium']
MHLDRADPIGKAGQSGDQHKIGTSQSGFSWRFGWREDLQQSVENGPAGFVPLRLAKRPAVAFQSSQRRRLSALSVVTAHRIRRQIRQCFRPARFDKHITQFKLADKCMVDCGVGAGASIQPGDVLPLALKARAGFAEVVAGNQQKQPRARLAPIQPQGLRQSVPRAFWFSLKNCVSSRRNIEDMQHQRMPRLYAGILRACLCPK